MFHCLFLVKEPRKLHQIKKRLKSLGFKDPYEIEDESGQMVLGGFVDCRIDKEIEDMQLLSQEEASIDWDLQWSSFAPSCERGVAHIDLSQYKEGASTLLLKSGGGFGDLSHSTTKVMLKMMGKERLEGYHVVDIGCGSGVLSLVAYRMGAKSIQGIDIDLAAVEHSKENQQLNGISEECILFDKEIATKKLSNEPYLVLMNMIRSEQVIAWEQSFAIHEKAKRVLISGILAEDKENYLTLAASWGWILESWIEEEGWLGLVFNASHQAQ